LPLDVTDEAQVADSLANVSPEVVIHLAGETSVASSWNNPARTMLSNVVGTTFLLEWIKQNNPSTHFVNATSVEVFDDASSVVSETSPMKAKNPYGISKLATAQFVSALRADGLRLTNAYLSNHESKYRPENFVMGKIARGVAAIADGKQETLTLGDISITRDWSSAEDICRGIKLIAEQEFVGDLILASGVNSRLSDIVASAFASVGVHDWNNYVKTDPTLLRNNDQRVVTYDVSLAKTSLNWSTTKSCESWISEMVTSFRD
jgi:GDPmannose 4,6-dehydratase